MVYNLSGHVYERLLSLCPPLEFPPVWDFLLGSCKMVECENGHRLRAAAPDGPGPARATEPAIRKGPVGRRRAHPAQAGGAVLAADQPPGHLDARPARMERRGMKETPATACA